MFTEQIFLATHFFKGPKTPKPPAPPKPPTPTTAADNVARQRLLDRQKNAQGFASTYLTGATIGAPDRARTLMNMLTGTNPNP